MEIRNWKMETGELAALFPHPFEFSNFQFPISSFRRGARSAGFASGSTRSQRASFLCPARPCWSDDECIHGVIRLPICDCRLSI